jgi:hypothetical protein
MLERERMNRKDWIIVLAVILLFAGTISMDVLLAYALLRVGSKLPLDLIGGFVGALSVGNIFTFVYGGVQIYERI